MSKNKKTMVYDAYGINRNKRKKRKAKTGLKVTLTLLIAALLAVGGLYVYKEYKPLEQIENRKVYKEAQGSPHKDVTYILIGGTDQSELRTDIMMVAVIDKVNKTVNVIQIPRDLWVHEVPNSHKFNAIYEMANIENGESRAGALSRGINSYLGLPIDYYMTFTIPAFSKVVDAVGGVDITMDKTIRYHDDFNGGWYEIGPGPVHLTGRDAVGFIRFRTMRKGDISRLEEARVFYDALIKKMLNMSMDQILDIFNQCKNDVSTDMATGDVVTFYKDIKGIDTKNIAFFGVPGEYDESTGTSYYSIHKQSYIDLINENFFPLSGRQVSWDDIDIAELIEPSDGSWMNGKHVVGEDNTVTTTKSYEDADDDNDE